MAKIHVRCRDCGAKFTLADLADFRDMGESYYHGRTVFICPDCYDFLARKDLEDQFSALIADKKEENKNGKAHL